MNAKFLLRLLIKKFIVCKNQPYGMALDKMKIIESPVV